MEPLDSVAAVTDKHESQWRFIDGILRGRSLQFLLDSGSDISLIRLDVAKQFRISYTPVRKRATSANVAHIKIIGIAHEQVELGGQRVPITLYVAALLSDRAILGANELAKFPTLVVHYGGSMPPLHVAASQLSDDQSSSLMNVSPQYVITLSHPDVKLVKVPSRKRSRADEKFNQQEIASLLKKKLIQPSKSPWRAQLHVVHDEIRDKKRLVVDYSGTVNPHTVIYAYPLPLIEPLIERVSQNQIFSSLDLRSAFHQIPLKPSERQLTAFEGDGHLYEWCVLPFGLTNSGAVFARVLGELVEGFPGCFHYLMIS